MSNTIFRLIVIIPGALLLIAVAIGGLGFAGLTLSSAALAVLLIGTAVAMIVWVFADHRRRARSRDNFSA